MVNSTFDEYSCNLYFIEFLNKIKAGIVLQKTCIETLKINVKIVENTNFNKKCCHAIVNNINGCSYQCTRKKKFGNLCGLHHNRKNSFKTIENKTNTKSKEYKLDLAAIANVCKKNNEQELYKISYNYIDYYIDNKGNLYLNDNNGYSILGHISDYNIPFKLS